MMRIPIVYSSGGEGKIHQVRNSIAEGNQAAMDVPHTLKASQREPDAT